MDDPHQPAFLKWFDAAAMAVGSLLLLFLFGLVMYRTF